MEFAAQAADVVIPRPIAVDPGHDVLLLPVAHPGILDELLALVVVAPCCSPKDMSLVVEVVVVDLTVV